MPVYAYLGGAWRKAKCVWFWTGSTWQKAENVYWRAGSWRHGFDSPDMPDTVEGASNAEEYPATIVMTWSIAGQKYGAQVEVLINGVSWAVYDAESYPTGVTLEFVDPTATFTVNLRDGNDDVVQTRTATITL